MTKHDLISSLLDMLIEQCGPETTLYWEGKHYTLAEYGVWLYGQSIDDVTAYHAAFRTALHEEQHADPS